MICYFANRRMEILAHASTELRDGLHIKDDKKIEEIEAGQDIFTGYLCYGEGGRLEAEAAAEPGNYLLKKGADKDEFYTIIESETDSLAREIHVYAEAAGLDLIGEVFEPFEAKRPMTLAEYAAKWLYDTGFEVGEDESEGAAKMLLWEDSETATARILSTAAKFGCEVSYRFEIDGLSIQHKYIDFHVKRGEAVAEPLRRGRDFEDLRISKSLANIATALRVTGGTPDGAGIRRQSDDSYTWVKFSEFSNGKDAEDQASMSDDPDGLHYIGLAPGRATDEESEDADVYKWGKIRKGDTYILTPSTSGYRQWVDIGGKARYTWVVFATDAKGSNMSDMPDDRTYMGISVNRLSPTKKTLASEYTWFPISNRNSDRDVFLSPGQGAVSEGNGLYTWIKYADDADGTNMSDQAAGKKYAGLRYHMPTDTESTDPLDYDWQEITLASTGGAFVRVNPSYPGIRQADGTFLWVRFAADSLGTNIAGTYNNRPYLGLAYDKESSIQSKDPADYEWTLIEADESQAVTLKGFAYDDGDFWIDSIGRLRSEVARQRWSRYISPDETGTDVGHIVAEFESDVTNQQALLAEAIAELTRRREAEISYDIELVSKRDDLHVGDTVPIVDAEGKLYLTARILKLETSEEKQTRKITLGNYARITSTLSDQVAKLTRQQREAAQAPVYTWTVYADSPTGEGIRLESDDAMYMGVANNKVSPTPDLTDPFEYTWTRIGGNDGVNGEDAIVLRVDSTRGLVFKNNWYDTQLKVTIVKGGVSITDITALRAEFGAGACLRWYFRKQADQEWSALSVSDTRLSESGFCLTVTPDDVDEQITFQCDLEA